jgi:hypothetical protein
MSFYIADGKVWVRNYQIVDSDDGAAVEKKLEHQGEEVTSLVEVGPRFVLCPIRIFSGRYVRLYMYISCICRLYVCVYPMYMYILCSMYMYILCF